MTEQVQAAAAQPKLSVRAGVNRKLLERKAAEKAAEAEVPLDEGVEACFPPDAFLEAQASDTVENGGGEQTIKAATPPDELAGQAMQPATALPAQAIAAPAVLPPSLAIAPQELANAASEQPAGAPPQPAAAATPWTHEDENAYQTLLTKRTSAGHRGRGRAVPDQLIGLGSIKPNVNIVVAIIVALVAERGGSVPRGELLTAMADATFPHPKAQPTDRAWCQGYVAGAVRNGFLTADAQPAALSAAA